MTALARELAGYTPPRPRLSAFDRVEALAEELKAVADGFPVRTDREVGLTAAVWHLAEGLRQLSLLGRAEAVEMVLSRALTAFEGESGAGA